MAKRPNPVAKNLADARYRKRVVSDKKKEASRLRSRKKEQLDEPEGQGGPD